MHRPEGIDIRALSSDDDLLQCVALQRATWGIDYDDIVPPSVLKVAQKIGGVAAGAFDSAGQMIGFVFGLPGVREGRIIHWSDMLAVREAARDSGVGQRLKQFQRTAALASGARTMYWTYDPLVARNAHMNFNRLGVSVDEYVEDMYGASASDLHRGLGTDRFIVAWGIDAADGAPARPVPARADDQADARILNADARTPVDRDLATLAQSAPAALRVEVPLDIVAVRDSDPDQAARWRASTRHAFQWALANGYTVARFTSDAERQRGHYVMVRRGTTGGAR